MSLLSKLLHAPRNIALLLAALVCSNSAYAQVPFNLSQGWNLLGNSSASAIDVTTAFSDKSKFTTVWTWNRTASKWAFYAPSMTSTELAAYALNKQYDVLTSIAPKEGFWVNAATTATLTGPVANGVTLAEGDLLTGWNLLGSADKVTPSQLNQGLNASLGAAGKSMTTAWAWDAQGSKWRFYAPSMEAQGGAVLTDYIANKQYLPFTAALSESEGFWLNIGTMTPTTNAAFVTAPVVNTPLDGVSVTLTCANGAIGGKSTASQGNVRIAVDPATCLAPYTMAVSGAGTMAGPDLKFGTADDETYDSATRASLKSVIQATDLGLSAGANLASGANVTAPAITSLTTMVAEAVAKPNFATPPTPSEISAAIANVQKVAGLSDPALVYANPLTNGAVFNAATLVNEMVANAVKADSTQAPNTLLKYMAQNTTGVTLNDATINPATLMGASTASTTVLDAQMATMQAKASAMKSVADAIVANLGSTSQANVTPAEAVAFLNTALTTGANVATAQQAIAQAQLAQDTMKQMATQMATMQVDTSIKPEELAAKMAAMAQGLNSVRVTQDQSIQTAIGNAGSDATAIANAVKTANTTAQSMITASAASLLSTVSSTAVTSLTNTYMSAIAGSITEQLGKIDATQLASATSGPPANLAAALANIGVDPTTMASAAATTAGQVLTLNSPSALANFPGLGDPVKGMVVTRALTFGWSTSGQLQAWVDAIGTALAKNDITLLNQNSVGFTLGNYFASTQPDLRTVPPSTLVLTIGAAPTFTTTTMPTGAPPVSALPYCSQLPSGITPIQTGATQNCNPATSNGGTPLPMCSTMGASAQPTVNCTPDTTGGAPTLAQTCAANGAPSGYTFPLSVPTYGGMTCP